MVPAVQNGPPVRGCREHGAWICQVMPVLGDALLGIRDLGVSLYSAGAFLCLLLPSAPPAAPHPSWGGPALGGLMGTRGTYGGGSDECTPICILRFIKNAGLLHWHF